MKPLAQWPLEARRGLVGVLTDIDDTLTTDGAITADALQALADLKAAGLVVIAITGRPVGWSEPFACTWPVDAIVAENGAVALQNLSQIDLQRIPYLRGQLSKLYIQDVSTRRANFARMQQVAQRVLAEVPGAKLSEDSAGRETDIAFDHSEFTQLSPDKIAQVAAILQSEGMHATVSSIHINGWFGGHDKWVGACWIVKSLLGRDLAAERDLWAYVGDSTNDQRMFEALPNSIGVANVLRFESQLACKPRYITLKERGAGFAEAVFAVLAARDGCNG
ncbi:MAG: HAD-IIB family hydrolase [Rhodoferax sp.]|uniref:HAD-IIB family hydrolase n=1 Tax=Rhodoferax sp. TaxID=50421 RepID=UPI003264E691